MGLLENTHIKLVAHELQETGEGINIVPKGAQPMSFPKKYKKTLNLISKGHSISEVVELTRKAEERVGFRRLLQVVEVLYDHGFIKNHKDFEKSFDSLRKPHKWSEPQIKKNFWQYSVSSGENQEGSVFGVILSLGVLIFSLSLIPQFLSLNFNEQFLQLSTGSYWLGLLTLFVFGSVILSFQGFVAALIYSGGFSVIPKMKLRLNFLGLYLETPQQPGGKSLYQVLSSLAIGGSLLLVALGLRGLRFNAGLSNDLLVLTCFYLLIQWSPFTVSYTTEIISEVFNSMRKKSQSGSHESFTYWIHQSSILIWIVAFATLSVAFLPAFGRGLAQFVESDMSTSGMLSMIILIIYFALFYEGMISDILNSFQYKGIKASISRIWKKSHDESEEEVGPEDGGDSFSILRSTQPFNQMPEEFVRVLSLNCGRRTIPTGGVICAQHSKGREMFVLLTGGVGVYRRHQRGGAREKIVDFHKGALFGEVGFFKGIPRTADVIAHTECEVLVIRWRPEYKNLVLEDEKFRALRDRIWLMQTLKSAPLFKKLPLEALDIFVGHGKVIDVPKEDIVIREGEASDGFYVIIQGEAQASKNGRPLRDMGRGDVFGEIGLLMNLKRTASVHATTPLKVLFIEGEYFWKILENNMMLSIALEKIASLRAKNT